MKRQGATNFERTARGEISRFGSFTRKLVAASMLAVVYLSMAVLAHADTLDGSQVTITADYPALGDAITIPVTKTVPAVFPSGSIPSTVPGLFIIGVNIDVDATSINFMYTQYATAASGTFNGWVLDFTGAPTITGVSLGPLSTFTSSQATLGFSADQITVNTEGLSITSSSDVQVDVEFSSTPPPSVVPEPSMLLLFGTGLLGLGPLVRRQLKRA